MEARGITRRRLLHGGMALAGVGLMTSCGLVRLAGRRNAGLHRIGFLNSGNNPPTSVEAFHAGLRELGHVDGQDVVIEYRDAQGDLARLPTLATELVQSPVEILVVENGPAALAASHV